MHKSDLKRSLEAELLKIERQDKKIYGVGETRYDLMIRDVLNYIDNSISKEVIEKKIEELEDKAKRIVGTYQYSDSAEDLENKKAEVRLYRTVSEDLQELLEGK